jgi:hypothetical protein
MTTCFRLDSIACVAIWRSAQWFLQGDPTNVNGHTACFKMILLLVSMEGLFCCDVEKDHLGLVEPGQDRT